MGAFDNSDVPFTCNYGIKATKHLEFCCFFLSLPIDHDDLCFKLFTEAGFDWGGDWTNRKDYQHFEVVE